MRDGVDPPEKATVGPIVVSGDVVTSTFSVSARNSAHSLAASSLDTPVTTRRRGLKAWLVTE